MLRTLAALALAVTACGGSSKTGTTTPSNKAEPPPLAAASDDVLAYLPVESEVVIGVEWQTARGSAIYKTFESEVAAGLGSRLQIFKDKCSYDPLNQIERITAGGKVTMGGFEGVLVIRGVTGANTLECLIENTEGREAMTVDKGVITIDRGGSGKTVATVVGGSTLVALISHDATPAALDATLRSASPLRTSPAFMQLFDRREPNPSVWGMINGNSQLLDMAAQAGARPKSVDGTLVLTDVFAGAVRMTFASPADADTVKKQVMQVVPMVAGNVEKIDVRTEGSILRMDVRATDAQLRAMLAMLEKMF